MFICVWSSCDLKQSLVFKLKLTYSASDRQWLSEQSVLLYQAMAPLLSHLTLLKLSTLTESLTQAAPKRTFSLWISSAACVQELCRCSWRRGKERRACLQNTAYCSSEKLEDFFFPEQARSQLALCCLLMTRVSQPQAKAPTKILGGADGLKTRLLPLPHMPDEPGEPHTHTHWY